LKYDNQTQVTEALKAVRLCTI